MNFEKLSITPQPITIESLPTKPKILVDTKPKIFGDREDHQRLANDIIKYNSTLIGNSPSKSNQYISQSPSNKSNFQAQQPRPKSSNYIDDELSLNESHSRSNMELRSYEDSDISDIENISHHFKSSRELKKNTYLHPKVNPQSVSIGGISQLTDSNNNQSILPTNQVSNSTENIQRNSQEIGIDFDVDRAFRRNR